MPQPQPTATFWTNADTSCILPLFTNTQKPSYHYYNEDQRNIHVWMSAVPTERNLSTTGQQVCLLAGAWSPNPDSTCDEHALILNNALLYRWLQYLYFPSGSDDHPRLEINACSFYDVPLSELNQDFVLLFMNDDDPRKGGASKSYSGYPEVAADFSRVSEGHYLVVKKELRRTLGQNRSNTIYSPVIVSLPDRPIVTRRTTSREVTTAVTPASGTKTPKSGSRTPGGSTTQQVKESKPSRRQKEATIEAVKDRDGRCRISGVRARFTRQGGNFRGLEVAHIYPIAETEQFRTHFKEEVFSTLYNELGLKTKPYKEFSIDIVQNCLLLRADLHSVFDQYEIAFEHHLREEGAHERLGVRLLLKDGAPTLPRIKSFLELDIPDPDKKDEMSRVLYTHHYLTALHWHIAGNGRPMPGNLPTLTFLRENNLEAGHMRRSKMQQRTDLQATAEEDLEGKPPSRKGA
ncbi:hypothetical protein B0H14DRAFT_2578992 [Mycena olivaceomarginata]|nr:hypothetical protein B0H14DRAFT_2578992 [Mycena olivaceomarginata]